jgi:anaerobic C4-dicarboxylate transporter
VTAVYAVALASTLVGFVVVLALFVWAARKDGEEDRAVQERTGVKRKTRLGR